MKRKLKQNFARKKPRPVGTGRVWVGARPIGEATKTQDLSRLAASSPTPTCQNAQLNTPDRATMFRGGEKG